MTLKDEIYHNKGSIIWPISSNGVLDIKTTRGSFIHDKSKSSQSTAGMRGLEQLIIKGISCSRIDCHPPSNGELKIKTKHRISNIAYEKRHNFFGFTNEPDTIDDMRFFLSLRFKLWIYSESRSMTNIYDDNAMISLFKLHLFLFFSLSLFFLQLQ